MAKDSTQKMTDEELEDLEQVGQVDDAESDTEEIEAESDSVNSTEKDVKSDFTDKNDWEGKYKRALADYQNLEKRSLEQRREWIRSSNRELLLRILPILDTLVLAKEHSEDKSLAVSVQLFLDVLKGEGVTRVETIGKEFDPHTMEAVSTEDGEDGKVLKEMQAGYLLHDTLLRPAMVVVGKK